MTEAFERLKALLNEKGSLTEEDITQVESELGHSLTDEERLWLSAEQHDRMAREGAEITVEQYVQATQTLESAEPGSPEYQEAERIIQAFESAA